jgi:starch phosphorylase
VKQANKADFAKYVQATLGRTVDPSSLYDVQVKRIHEYKRQHLNLLHAMWLHDRVREGRFDELVPRTFFLMGKAAPGYRMAKLIIRLAHAVADVLEADEHARELVRVVFVPDFNVKNAQRIYPAADLSEQISTAGKEASGTGNMKLSMNGALTIGTLDGANVEIRDAVGAERFFLFGMTAEEVVARRAGYDPKAVIAGDPELEAVLDRLGSGYYASGDRELFAPLVRNLVEQDPFFVLADFRAYVTCQAQVSAAWQDEAWWTEAAIRNVAGMGRFSSDRAIREYAERIWNVSPVPIGLGPSPSLRGGARRL